MNYVSFSLWGDDPIYNVGSIRNSELVKVYYPGWTMIVYYDNSVPEETIKTLIKNNVKVINLNGIPYGSFWRFFASDIEDCEYVVFRDCDSRVSERECLAVNQWVKSEKTVHIMRDHPAHRIPYGANNLGILAGMWGIKGNVINMTDIINKFLINKKNYYGLDQNFLQNINAMFKNNNLTHDEFFGGVEFPIKRKDGRFIGERIDINENPINNDYEILL